MNHEDEKQDISLAVLSRDIHHMNASISELKTQFSAIMSNYVTRSELASIIDAQTKLHEDIESRMRRQEERDVTFETRLAKLSTEIKIWLTVGAFIIGAAEGIAFILISKLL